MVVALNKIDVPNANQDRVLGELSERGLMPEAYGGETVTVPVSAKTGEGIDDLLENILVVAELEDLKANQNMMQLTEELASTENKVAFARQAFNDAVMAYNTRREVFPSNMIAGLFNFGAAELFQIEDSAQKAVPKVSFT